MRADRLVKLLLWLQGRGRATVPELARALEVSERTVHRDLDALSGSGVPIVTTRGQHGGVALMPGWKTELTGLSRAELHALATVSPARALEDVGLSEPLGAGLVKLAAAVPAFQQPQLEYARQRIHVDASTWFGGRDEVPFLRRLRDAIWLNRRVALTYRDLDGHRLQRVVEPYGLVLKADRWYLVAFSDGEPRTYRGSRIERVRTRPQTFTRASGFDLPAYWRAQTESFATRRPVYEVRLRLTTDAARALREERPAADQQRIDGAKPARDGRREVVIDFERETIAVSQLTLVGGGVEVLAPEPLRVRLRALGDALQSTYAQRAGVAGRRGTR